MGTDLRTHDAARSARLFLVTFAPGTDVPVVLGAPWLVAVDLALTRSPSLLHAALGAHDAFGPALAPLVRLA